VGARSRDRSDRNSSWGSENRRLRILSRRVFREHGSPAFRDRSALGGASAVGLDPVTVGILEKRGVVVRRVVGAHPRLSIVGAAMAHPGRMKLVDTFAIGRIEAEMQAGTRMTAAPVGRSSGSRKTLARFHTLTRSRLRSGSGSRARSVSPRRSAWPQEGTVLRSKHGSAFLALPLHEGFSTSAPPFPIGL